MGRVSINDGTTGWTYQKTVYGDTTNRDGFVGAIATVVINNLPSGVSVVIKIVKNLWNGFVAFLGFGNYSPKYLKAVMYTKNDMYYSRTKVVYYKYSDSKRTKLIDTETRIHEVQLKDMR